MLYQQRKAQNMDTISVDCQDTECGFTGDVQAYSNDFGYEWEFVCPKCGATGMWVMEGQDA